MLHNWSPLQRSNYFHAIGYYNMADAENFEEEAKARGFSGNCKHLTFNTRMCLRPLEEITLDPAVVGRRRRNTI